jgi:spore coat polysaccharide biosynthesis predicted glycosyltransferase SpsG
MALAEVAEEWGVSVRFVGDFDGSSRVTLEDRGFLAVQPASKGWVQDLSSSDVVVFDGYRFGPADFQAAGARGARVAAIDDLGEGSYPVDVLLHQNLAESTAYDLLEGTQCLVGPTYSLVRREFRSRRRLRRHGRRLLITFGGSDVRRLGREVAAWASAHEYGWEVRLLVGPAAPQTEVSEGIEVVSAQGDVGALFDWADVAIAAAGSVTWELCCMGVPSVLIEVADNQQHIGRPVARQGAAFFGGTLPIEEDAVCQALSLLANPEIREPVSERGMKLVDGKGAYRVLNELLC